MSIEVLKKQRGRPRPGLVAAMVLGLFFWYGFCSPTVTADSLSTDQSGNGKCTIMLENDSTVKITCPDSTLIRAHILMKRRRAIVVHNS